MKADEKGITTCPSCGYEVMSKPIMAKKLLDLVRYKPTKTRYSDGNLNRAELSAVYHWVRTLSGKVK